MNIGNCLVGRPLGIPLKYPELWGTLHVLVGDWSLTLVGYDYLLLIIAVYFIG